MNLASKTLNQMLQWDIKTTKNIYTLLGDVSEEFKKDIMTNKAHMRVLYIRQRYKA